MIGQVDHRIVAIVRDGQIAEARDTGEADGVDLDLVLVNGEVRDGVIPVTGLEHEGVIARAAVKPVVAGVPTDDVIAFFPEESVVAGATGDLVVSLPGQYQVVAALGENPSSRPPM